MVCIMTWNSENKPRGLYFSMALFVRLIFGGAHHMFGRFIFGGKFEFQNRLGLPYSWKEIYRFCFVLLCKCNWGQFPITSPRGAYIWSGDLREGFLRYEFGGTYIWRGLFSEGLRGLSTDENLRFKIDWASLIKLEVSLPFLLCFTLYGPAGLIFGGAI